MVLFYTILIVVQLLYLQFIIAVHLSDFLPIIIIEGHSKFLQFHITILVSLCRRLYRFKKVNLRNVAEAGARTHDL